MREQLVALETLLRAGWPRDDVWRTDYPNPEALAVVLAAVADLEAEGIDLPELKALLAQRIPGVN